MNWIMIICGIAFLAFTAHDLLNKSTSSTILFQLSWYKFSQASSPKLFWLCIVGQIILAILCFYLGVSGD